MKTKRCTDCQKSKPLTEFAINKTKKDGLNYRCKKCQRAYFKQYYQRNKQQCLDRVSRNKQKYRQAVRRLIAKHKKQCSSCPENHPAALDFHHKNPKTKKFNLRDATHCTSSLVVVEQEIRKCVVLCSNCHRKLHWEDNPHDEVSH
jgi:hypothetical protein